MLVHEIDYALNVDTYYIYDSSNGNLLASVNSDSGNGICYTYDGFGRLESVMPAEYVAYRNYAKIEGEEAVEYEYTASGLLSSVSTESTTYTFTYDAFGNAESVKAGDYELASYEYNDKNGKLIKISYSNGHSVDYVYNSLELLSEIWYNKTDEAGTLAYEYEYTAEGRVSKLVDNINGRTTLYLYNSGGFIKKVAGQKAAETVGWWQNKCVVKGVMALKGAIYDCGGALTGAYAKEVALTKGYQYLYNVWLM